MGKKVSLTSITLLSTGSMNESKKETSVIQLCIIPIGQLKSSDLMNLDDCHIHKENNAKCTENNNDRSIALLTVTSTPIGP